MVACEKGNIELVLLLLQYKAKINLQAVDGSTALHIATRKGHEEIVQALIDANVDITLKNSKGQTTHDVAIDKGLDRIAVMIDFKSCHIIWFSILNQSSKEASSERCFLPPTREVF